MSRRRTRLGPASRREFSARSGRVRLRKGTGGLPTDSVLKCEQITTLPKGLLSEAALGGLSAGLLQEVERGVLRAIGLSVD